MSEQERLMLVVILSLSAVNIVGFLFWLRKVFRQRREEVEKRFLHQKIMRQHHFAHFYGLESVGFFQMRGNGVLVMTADELYFLLALPRREFRIPLETITSVSNPWSHLGKSNFCKLLRVDFSNGGKKDAIAWMVGRDVDAWTRAVEEARKAVGRV